MKALCRRPHRRAGSERRLIIGLALLLHGCAAPTPYLYDTDLPVVMVGNQRDETMRIVSKGNAPIPPVKFGQWFISSSWAIRLSLRWADLPYAFEEMGPEYCVALGVDRNRMLHASAAVRYRDDKAAAIRCPGLIWIDGDFMIELSTSSHGHQTLAHHGERISVDDAALGGPMRVESSSGERMEMSRLAVNFYSGEHLMGIDPATGTEAPVPAQSLFFSRFNGVPHVFLWTPFNGEAAGKSHFVRVYKPAANDGWDEVAICWAVTSEIRQAVQLRAHAPVHCNPDDFWLR